MNIAFEYEDNGEERTMVHPAQVFKRFKMYGQEWAVHLWRSETEDAYAFSHYKTGRVFYFGKAGEGVDEVIKGGKALLKEKGKVFFLTELKKYDIIN